MVSPELLLRRIGKVIEFVLGRYVEVFALLLRAMISIAGVEVKVLPWEPKPAPIDERLAKLEVARAALSDSLSAIEDLQSEAEIRKKEHAEISSKLQSTLANKDDAERKLQSIKSLIIQDVEAFQALAGVPDVRRERLIGFGSGVAASIIASIIYTIANILLKRFGMIA
jgi:hypothetical protein